MYNTEQLCQLLVPSCVNGVLAECLLLVAAILANTVNHVYTVIGLEDWNIFLLLLSICCVPNWPDMLTLK